MIAEIRVSRKKSLLLGKKCVPDLSPLGEAAILVNIGTKTGDAAITGWRIASEVLPLEWRQVDMTVGEVRLDAHPTKNGDGRVFPFTTDLRALLKAREAERDRLKKAGHPCPYVFFREVAEERGGEKKPRRIRSFTKMWQRAFPAGYPMT